MRFGGGCVGELREGKWFGDLCVCVWLGVFVERV